MVELFECAMLATAIVSALMLMKRTGSSLFGVVAAVVLVILLDNAFGVHEFLGGHLSGDNPAIGEAVWGLLVGAILAGWCWRTFLLSEHSGQVVLAAVAVAVAYIASFAILLDLLHGLFVAPFSQFDGVLTVVEDGNELVGITLLCALLTYALTAGSQKTSTNATQHI